MLIHALALTAAHARRGCMRARVWQPTVTAQYYYAWHCACPFISAVRALDTLARDYIYIFYITREYGIIDPHRAVAWEARGAAAGSALGLGR